MKDIHKILYKLSEKEILESQVMTAYINSLMQVNDQYDLFYFLSSMNLLNAYVKKDYADIKFINRYTFKNHLAKVLDKVVFKELDDVHIYYTNEILYIDVFNVQFSFHNVKATDNINRFKNSTKNKKKEWKGIRLQPIASQLFELAQNKYDNLKNKSENMKKSYA